MKIAILLPYKENYSPKYSGAVSIHVSNLLKFSKFKSTTFIYGNTKSNNYLTKNFYNINFKKNILSSNNKKYIKKFIDINKNKNVDLIEIHNRPSYFSAIKQNLNSKIIIYFHNDPLTLSGSKKKEDRINLIKNCDYIFFNSNWTKNKFFTNINEQNYLSKFGICFQSTKKSKVNLSSKQKLITFVGKLNEAKGYDVFGKAILKILDEFPEWKSTVIGDEPREKHIFNHKNLKILSFQENNFVLSVLKKSSIFVACSKWEEPFGRSSLEACSAGCATIITNRGGLTETTKHPIILEKLDAKTLYSSIKKLIKKPNFRKKIQKLNYNSFFLTHEYVSSIIDKARSNLFSEILHKSFNFNKNSKLKIIHITNFNHRYFGRLQYNTGIRINNGLIREGHNVLSISDRDIISYSRSFSDPSGENYLNKLVSKTIENFRPDLLILGHADRIDPQSLLDAKNKYSNLKISQWFLDPLSKHGPDFLKNKLRVLNKSKICDATFITTSPDALDFKIKNSFFIPNPCDSSLDHLENFRENKIYDIFYAISHGVHRGKLRTGKIDERENFIAKLKSLSNGVKFDIYGMFGREPIWGDNFLSNLSNSNMAINLSRGKPTKYYSSDRIAQLVGNGLLTFIDERTKYGDFFENDEMIFYKDILDLSEKIKRYKKDKKLGFRIAKKGHLKYHKYFNCSLVSKYIIERTFGSNSKFYWDR